MSNSSTEKHQGQLYQRIEKEAWKTEPEPYVFTVMETKHIIQLLDEAKADFPSWEKGFEGDEDDLLAAQQDWAKKWFGE